MALQSIQPDQLPRHWHAAGPCRLRRTLKGSNRIRMRRLVRTLRNLMKAKTPPRPKPVWDIALSSGRYWMDLRPLRVLGRLAGLPTWKKPSIPAARLERSDSLS